MSFHDFVFSYVLFLKFYLKDFQTKITLPVAMNVFNIVFNKFINRSQSSSKIGYVGYITAEGSVKL